MLAHGKAHASGAVLCVWFCYRPVRLPRCSHRHSSVARRLSIPFCATSRAKTSSASPRAQASAWKARKSSRSIPKRGSASRAAATGRAKPKVSSSSRRTNTFSSSSAPSCRRIADTTGQVVDNYELELKVKSDIELIKNRLYFASNLLYEPEATHDPDRLGIGWVKESKAGLSGALSYRVVPDIFIGAEAWYLRHYDGSWFNRYTGSATFLGPTLYIQLGPKMFMTAAWNVQLQGTDVDDPAAKLNLSEFSRQRAKLKLAVEF